MLFDPNPFGGSSLQLAAHILGKLMLGLLLGGAIGWEREIHGRPAGVRTHMLVVMGVVLISEVSRYFGGSDPSRIAAQIITGIGFLGAGTIMRQGAEVKGLTTAASVWAASAIGMAISVGGAFYWVAVVATALALTTLTYVDRLDRRLNPLGHPREIIITLSTRADLVSLMQKLTNSRIDVRSVKVLDEGPPTQVALTVSGSGDGVIPIVSTLPGVVEVRWS